LAVDADWLERALTDKIRSIDWDEASDDVRRFLRPAEEESLSLWGERFFESKLRKLMDG